MTDNEIITALKQKNPFISSASPLPWVNSNPDLSQLNREASEEILQLILYKRREPDTPLSGVILGESGSGKTHMLYRILRRLKSNASPVIFVTVRAFKDPQTSMQHLLKETFISLRELHSNGRIQFDVLMSELIDSYHEHRRSDGYDKIENLNPIKYLGHDIKQIDRNFLRCIVAYINSGDSIKRETILDWIVYGLADEDSIELGLPLRNLDNMSDSKREQDAENILISLGMLLSYAKIPMVMCFDELDAMSHNKDLVISWGGIISFIINNLSGILPLCFMKDATWKCVFVNLLDDSTVQRLRHNIISMKTCSLLQAQQLINSRIKSVFKDDKKSEEIYKWLINRMKKNLLAGYSPRFVIELANQAITKADIQNIDASDNESREKSIKEIYEDEYRKVQANPSAWPPNTEQLVSALEIWLKAHEGFKFEKSNIKNMQLVGVYKNEIKFAFITVITKNHFAAKAGAKHGIDFINENPYGVAYYITESKNHKKTWRQANETLKKFENLGGRVLFLDDNSRIKWYALTALINRIDNGDVNLYSSSGNRTATRDDLKDFLKNLRLVDFPFEIDKAKIQNSDVIIKAVIRIINALPMKIVSISKIIELLPQQNIRIEPAKLSELIQNHKNIFQIFPSKDELLFALRKYEKND